MNNPGKKNGTFKITLQDRTWTIVLAEKECRAATNGSGIKAGNQQVFFMVIAMITTTMHLRISMFVMPKQKAVIGINPIELLEGALSPKARALVLEWANMHQDELMSDWDLARQQAPLNKIDPLE